MGKANEQRKVKLKKNKNTQSNNPPESISLTENSATYHVPVLLNETLEELSIHPDGVYVDCTFGGGGHSTALLNRLGTNGKLFAFDQDADAQQNLPNDERVVFVLQNFRHMQRFLKLHGISQVDGILADLGVSSHQFDEAERGFSIRYNADLDMRMDRRQPVTAFDIVQQYSEQKLHKLFEQYGEVTNAKTLAKTIVSVRSVVSLKTIDGFKNALRAIVMGNPNKYLAQVFQALRMEVNEEMPALKEMLQQSLALLKPGGRIAVITFHSIEDRLVKHFLKEGTFDVVEAHPFENAPRHKYWKVITKKPITATNAELQQNSRSRSAKLRVAERV